MGEVAAGGDVRQSVRRARRLKLAGDLLLVAPLFLFLIVIFAAPILFFMYRAVDNALLHQSFPRTHAALANWDVTQALDDAAYGVLAEDIKAIQPPAKLAVVARTLNTLQEGYRSLLMKTGNKLAEPPQASWRDTFLAIDKRWGAPDFLAVLKYQTGRFTPSYLLAALDLERDASGGIMRVEPERRLYVPLLLRTFEISFTVALICLALGYPTAFVLTRLQPGTVALLMICVMLPFWTSLLVRTTAWIVLLQGNGPINGTLLWLNAISEPMELIFNRFGVLVAMSHVLLPYMILPLYSVMKGISETHMRAAQSLGAKPRIAFLRVYLPQTVPGIAAGLLLVFILALGYYITPALVGGPRDQMLSYMITYHVNEVVNWGMASALGLMLLATTAILLLVLSRLIALKQFLR